MSTRSLAVRFALFVALVRARRKHEPAKWLETPDKDTWLDAWKTLTTWFAPAVTFQQLVNDAQPRWDESWSIRDLVTLKVENMNFDMVADPVYLDYPPDQRTRAGTADQDSVRYAATTTNPQSPIVIVRMGFDRFLLLDGMHRIMGAKQRGANMVRVHVVNLESVL